MAGKHIEYYYDHVYLLNLFKVNPQRETLLCRLIAIVGSHNEGEIELTVYLIENNIIQMICPKPMIIWNVSTCQFV